MIKKYNYPPSITMEFLDHKYRYRSNGDYMILIHNNISQTEFDSSCSDEEIRRKAIQNSASGKLRSYETTKSFVRDRYVCEYAKRRAKGVCQLCGQPAPFKDKNGMPYLETHHIIWLADGGDDSINNTVALCPNCHRKMHTLNMEEDVRKLLNISRTLNEGKQ